MPILLLIICLYLVWTYGIPYLQSIEHYKQCYMCDDDSRTLDGGMVVLNPYKWPYSGTKDVERIYQQDERNKADFGFKQEPLIHNTTPDHVILM